MPASARVTYPDRRTRHAAGNARAAGTVLCAAGILVCAAGIVIAGGTGAVALASPSANIRSPSSRWAAPVSPPVVVARFAPPAQRWLPGHRGVDIAASDGAPVTSAGEGTVAFAGVIAGRGVVSVRHGALRTTYEPIDAVVSAGEHVGVGEVIGTVSAGGHCSNICVHWGLLSDDQYLDPLLLLSPDPPVLKPPRPGRSQNRLGPRNGLSSSHFASSATARRSNGALELPGERPQDDPPNTTGLASTQGNPGSPLGSAALSFGAFVAAASAGLRRRKGT